MINAIMRSHEHIASRFMLYKTKSEGKTKILWALLTTRNRQCNDLLNCISNCIGYEDDAFEDISYDLRINYWLIPVVR